MVVLAVDPRRIGQHGQHVRATVGRCGQGAGVVGGPGILVPGPGHRPAVERGLVAEGAGGDIAQHLAVEPVEDAQTARAARRRLGDPAHHRRAHLPPPAHLLDPGQVLGGDDGQHPLLALGGHHLVGRHARLATGHGRDVDVHAHAAPGRGLTGGTHQTRPAQVLDTDHQLGVEELEARLDQALLLVGVADLHARPLGRTRPSPSSPPNPAEANTLTPPIPSRPVEDPRSTARFPTPVAAPSTSRSVGSTPMQSTLTSGFWA